VCDKEWLLKDDEIIADWTICGVLDHYTVDGERTMNRKKSR
jgi:hypothetical protein